MSSKSVSEILKEQGVILTDTPNFEQPETTEKTRVEKAIDITNQKVSNKCLKGFKKFVNKYKVNIDFEKYEGKEDALMKLIDETIPDTEKASLARHAKHYCESVLRNLSKIDTVIGINGSVCSKEELAESVNVMDAEEISESKAILTSGSGYDADKRTAIEAVMKQMQEEEAKEEADKISLSSKPEAKIESAPTASVTKKTTRYIEKEPKMTEYRKAGKINQYFDDLKIWQQYTA